MSVRDALCDVIVARLPRCAHPSGVEDVVEHSECDGDEVEEDGEEQQSCNHTQTFQLRSPVHNSAFNQTKGSFEVLTLK